MESENTTALRVRTYARIAGVLYLVVIVCAGFSEGYVRSSLIVAGDASATAHNIMASEWLFRLGFVSDLVAFLADAGVAILLYVLLRPVNRILSVAAAVFRLLAHPGIAGLNLLNHYTALLLLGGAEYLNAFDPQQLEAMALVSLESHTYGYLIAGAFFGIHCLVLGYLLYRSTLFPKILGVLLVLAAAGYLTESFGNFMLPQYETFFAWVVAIPAVIGEVSLCLYLMIKGVRETEEEVVVAA